MNIGCCSAKKKFASSMILTFVLLLGVVSPLLIHLIPAKAEDQPKYGGTLVRADVSEPSTLNPCLTTAWTVHLIMGSTVFETLVNYDENGNPIPRLATDWEVSEDGLTYTFHLIKNATWHDGEPFTSADVKFTVEEVLLKYHPGAKAEAWAELDNVETPDDYTVVFKLKSPWSPLMKFLQQNEEILPKHLYEGTDILENPYNLKPIGTGPFKFVEYVKGDHITFEKNENYWKKGKPYLDKIINRIIPSYETMVMALEKKEINYIPYYFPPYEAERVNALPGISVVSEIGFKMSSHRLAYKMTDPILSNLKVRQALWHAIDREELLEVGWYDQGLIMNSFIPDIPQLAWVFQGRTLENPYPYDVDEANRLLDEAGYPRGTDGVRFSLECSFHSLRPEYVQAGALIKDYLEEVGIDLDVKLVEFSAWCDKVFVQEDFEACLMTGYAALPDPHSSIKLHHSRYYIPGAQWLNNWQYNNSKVDELFDKAVVEMDINKRGDMYYEIALEMQKDAMSVWLNLPYIHYGIDDDFKGLPQGPSGMEPMDSVWYTKGEALAAPFPLTEVLIAIAVIAVVIIVGVAILYRRRKAA